MKAHNSQIYLVIVLSIALFLTFGTFLSMKAFEKTTVTHYSSLTSVRAVSIARNVVKIMPLGDSITAGVGSTAWGGYRVDLWNDCAAAHWRVTFVGSQSNGPASLPDKQHEGHPGWRVDQISDNVVQWLDTYQPQIILLHIGSNDIIHHYHASTAPARLSYLLNQITTTLPHAIVIVAQITPLGNPQLDAEVVTYNRAIPAIVRSMDAQGKHIEYVDMYNAVPVSDLVDGIHPNDQGYAQMAEVWFHALKPIMASPTPL
jgi:lysophospholipase L1-like esterase